MFNTLFIAILTSDLMWVTLQNEKLLTSIIKCVLEGSEDMYISKKSSYLIRWVYTSQKSSYLELKKLIKCEQRNNK